MAQITNQTLWRRGLNHVAADLKMLASIAAGEKITVEQAAHASLKGDAYKPSPAIADLDAIEDVIRIDLSNTNCPRGENTLSFPVVPAGKIWIVTNVLAWVVGAWFYEIEIIAVVGGTDCWLRRFFEAASNQEIIFNGKAFLNEGDRIKAVFDFMGLGEDIFANLKAKQIDKY